MFDRFMRHLTYCFSDYYFVDELPCVRGELIVFSNKCSEAILLSADILAQWSLAWIFLHIKEGQIFSYLD